MHENIVKSTNFSSDQFLSVIIPAYNAAGTIGEQLEALKAQTYNGNWEIIIINNRSIDNTVEIVQNYQDHMPHLRLVDALERQTKGYACNVGAKAARGDAFILCDADDVAASGWIAGLAEALKAHDVVAGNVEEQMLNQSAVWRPSRDNEDKPKSLEKPFLGFLPFASGCNLAISRQAFEAVGGFLECENFICEDVDICWRLQLHGYAIHYAPAAIMHYRHRDTFRGYWKQIAGYAACCPLLYQRFAAQGMPPSSVSEALSRYFWLLKKTRKLYRTNTRKRWLFRAAASWGRIQGSMRHRTFYI